MDLVNHVNPVDMVEYAATLGIKEEEALTRGLEEKSREFVEKGAEVYSQA